MANYIGDDIGTVLSNGWNSVWGFLSGPVPNLTDALNQTTDAAEGVADTVVDAAGNVAGKAATNTTTKVLSPLVPILCVAGGAVLVYMAYSVYMETERVKALTRK
jgi:hypothetical protein